MHPIGLCMLCLVAAFVSVDAFKQKAGIGPPIEMSVFIWARFLLTTQDGYAPCMPLTPLGAE